MKRDVMDQLAAVNPVDQHGLARLDDTTLTALREAVIASPTDRPGVRRRVVGPRAAAAAVAALGVLGGGVAYAVTTDHWFGGGGGSHDGLTCMTQWVDPGAPNAAEARSTGGVDLTGDPVADCQRYQQLNGLDLIQDPVAFTYDDLQTYVAPRAQVPDGAQVISPTADDPAVFELWLSLNDLVGDPGARCLDPDAAAQAARTELDRLGLSDWTVNVSTADAGTGHCAAIVFEHDPVIGRTGGAPISTTLVVEPGAGDDRANLATDPAFAPTIALRDTLRTQIADTCVDLETAETIALTATAGDPSTRIVPIVDDTTACTRVYLVVGGSAGITLYGPSAG